MKNSVLSEKSLEQIERNSEIKVSVIIPAYNVEKYIDASMTSIRNQTLEDIEIICVDDGSQDKTLHMLQEMTLQDQRIQVISQENQGQSVARNVGLAVASGEYVYFFDSDDMLEENALEILYHHACQTNSELVLFDSVTLYDNDELSQEFEQYRYCYQRKHDYKGVYKGEELFVLMHEQGDYHVSPCLQFLSRQYLIANDLSFRKGIIHEDNIFSLKCLVLSSRVSHLRLNLFRRRIREQSTITTKPSIRNYFGYSICYMEMTRFLMEHQDELSKSTVMVARKLMLSFVNSICRIYISISADQKVQHQLHDSELDMLNIITHPFVLRIESQYKELDAVKQKDNTLQNELERYKKEVDDLKGSLSFKCGRVLTFVPRKLRGCLRHVRTNGIKATIKYCVDLIKR